MINKFNMTIPKFIESEFKIVRIKKVKLSKLRIKVTNKISRKVANYMTIKKTPHYSFVKSHLNGVKERSFLGYKNYKEYNEYNKHYQDVDNFKLFIDNINKRGFIQNYSKIICRKSNYYLFNRSYVVLDGSHRLAVIQALNHKYVYVAIAVRKKNLIFRILSKLKSV